MKARWQRWFVVAVACGVAAVTTGVLRAQQGAPVTGEWRNYGGDLGNTKYSPLAQINPQNFSQLRLAWRWKSADGFVSRTIPGRGEVWASSRLIFEELRTDDPKRWRDNQAPGISNFKATPLMVGGRLYLNTPTSIGAAIDARTGETLWIYNPQEL